MTSTASIIEMEPKSLAEQAYQQLLRMITRLELGPGQIIYERLLMQDMKIGRTPIREALYRLVGEGLIVHHHNRGMFIADINATSVKHIYEFRSLIEIDTVRLAAQRASSADIMELQAIRDRMLEIAATSDVELYVELDGKFYTVLAGAAENVFLREVIPRVFNHHLRVWFYIASKSGRWSEIMRAHAEMVEEVVTGITQRDPDRAASAVKKYISERYRDATEMV